MQDNSNPIDRITYSALEAFLARGIKKTSISEIAEYAGITRITAYRYFGNKKEIVKSAFASIVDVFERVEKEIKAGSVSDIESALDRINAGLSNLPKGNLMSLMEELKRLYPDIHDEVNARRVASLTKIFKYYSSNRRQIGRLREDVDPVFVQAFFGDMIVNMIHSTAFASLGFSQDEMFRNIKSIVLHGILKE